MCANVKSNLALSLEMFMLQDILKIIVFAFGVVILLSGLFLCSDALFPKEKVTSFSAFLIEFAAGIVLVTGGAFVLRRFRLGKGGP